MTAPPNPDDAFNVGLPITLSDLRRHLNLTAEIGDIQSTLLRSKILAATGLVEKQLGYPLSDFEDGTPEPVLEAIRQVAATFYENREPLLIGQGIQSEELPFTVADLLEPYKEWVF